MSVSILHACGLFAGSDLRCRERAKDLAPPGVESVSIVVDYKSTTLRTNPSLSTARRVLNILQNHYVETLGRGLVVNLPSILAFFYKGLSPFMDPVTRDKACAIFHFYPFLD